MDREACRRSYMQYVWRTAAKYGRFHEIPFNLLELYLLEYIEIRKEHLLDLALDDNDDDYYQITRMKHLTKK